MVLDTPDDKMRAVGLSFAKIASIKDLARKTLDGVVPPSEILHTLGDDEIVERITQVRGIGRWTVEMMLMSRLGRPDVLPIDDFGVRNGFRLAYGLRGMPTTRALAEFGARWAPYRSVAAWYLWRAVDLHREGKLPAPATPTRIKIVKKKRVVKQARKVVKRARRVLKKKRLQPEDSGRSLNRRTNLRVPNMRRSVSALARLALAASSLSFTPPCEAEAAPAPPQDCRVGFYRLQDGTGIDVGNTSSASLRWRRADGTSGALHGEPGKELTSTLGWTDRPMATAFLLAIARRARSSSMALRGAASSFRFANHSFKTPARHWPGGSSCHPDRDACPSWYSCTARKTAPRSDTSHCSASFLQKESARLSTTSAVRANRPERSRITTTYWPPTRPLLSGRRAASPAIALEKQACTAAARAAGWRRSRPI